MIGSAWGPPVWDPQLSLALSLARVRPEVFLLLVPVLQHSVLLATGVCKPEKRSDLAQICSGSLKWKRPNHCRCVLGTPAVIHGIIPKEK